MKAVVMLVLATAAVAMLPEKGKWLKQEPPGYVISTFTCFVDNFGFDDRVFNIRVFTYNQTYTAGGPILFYTGNEGAIEMFIDASGNLPVLAQQLGAVLIFAEHRYFGSSMPFGAQSLSTANNAKYLSPQQALADYARLVSALKMEYGDVPVIAVGGSYGGMLAAWFRIKYPHLIDGALAASAPLFHFSGTVLPEYFNAIVTIDYAETSDTCPQYIYTGFQYLNNNTYNTRMYYSMQTAFKTCQVISHPADVQNLINYLNGAYVYMAMTDYPYPTNFLNPMPADPVTVACSMMDLVVNPSNMTQILNAMNVAAGIYYNYSGSLPCNDISADSDALGFDGWDYLSCSTLVMPMAQQGMPEDMFVPQPWDYPSFALGCRQSYGRDPQPMFVQDYFGISDAPFQSLRYISNIIFSSGSLDPWQSGAVISQPTSSNLSILILGGAHHLDLRAPNPADPTSVVNARTTELTTIQGYIASVPK